MIVTNESVKESTKRLEEMKKTTLLKFLDEIDFDDEISLYDVMIEHFTNGELDDSFYSPVFKGLADTDKKKLTSLAHEYLPLCFYQGNYEYWLDSVEGLSINDFDLIALKILDNYSFLLGIAKDGGKEALEQMRKFQDCDGYSDCSVVEYLRNTFASDEILRAVILEMSKEDSQYNVFTDEQKASLCSFPEGTLYFFDGNSGIKFSSPIFLALEINQRITGENLDSKEKSADILFKELADALRKEPSFNEVVTDMSFDYANKYGKALDDMMSFIKKVEGRPSKDYWNVDKTPLGQFVDTPYNPDANVKKK